MIRKGQLSWILLQVPSPLSGDFGHFREVLRIGSVDQLKAQQPNSLIHNVGGAGSHLLMLLKR